MPDGSLADQIAADPKAAWHALNCADARDSLHDFCGMVELPGVLPSADSVDDDLDSDDIAFPVIVRPNAAHHRLLIDTLEAVERGVHRRAMFFLPPGSAKSTYGSVAFPAWCMGRKKGRNIGVATYATDLARKIGRRVRSIIKQTVYRDIFGTGLEPGQGAADEWALENGNEFMGAGLMAGWTGNRLDGIVIDDPVKNREEASSPTIQAKLKEEYDATINSRLKPGGWVMIIQTRWDENDLAGQILPEGWDGESGDILCRDGLVWHVVCIPAEAVENDPLGRAPGEMLWPEWFGRDPIFWTSARNNVRTWSALYQQRPSPADGAFFMKAWFDGGHAEGRDYPRRRYKIGAQPRNLKTYISSDHAPTDGENSDPNVARVWGIDPAGDLWLLDGFNRVQKMDKTADAIIALIQDYKPFAWFPEDDNNYKSAAPFIEMKMRKEGVRTRIEPMSPHGHDKASKAQSFQGMAATSSVWIPEGPEGDAIISEMVKFPAGKHDEEVDVAAIMGRAIAMAHPAIVPPEKPEPGEVKGIGQMTFDQAMQTLLQPKVDRV